MNDDAPVDQECVEGYLFVRDPLRLLILRRPPARGSIWAPVSGKVEAGDPDYPTALRRELLEETGFRDPVALTDLRWSVRFTGPTGGRWRLHAFGVELDRERPPSLSPEHVEYDWLALPSARSRLHYGDNREAVDHLEALLRAPGPRPEPS